MKGLLAAFSLFFTCAFSALASDNTVSVLVLSDYYDGEECRSKKHSNENNNDPFAFSKLAFKDLAFIRSSNLYKVEFDNLGEAINKHITLSDSKGSLSSIKIQIVDIIPFVINGVKNGQVSFDGLYDEIVASAYVNAHRNRLKADFIWLKTFCQNADNLNKVAIASNPGSFPSSFPSTPPIIVSGKGVKSRELAHEFGHILTLHHGVEELHSTGNLKALAHQGTGAKKDKGNHRYELSLMAYCPNTILPDGTKKKGRCSYLDTFSDGSVTETYIESIASQIPASAGGRNFVPNSMAVIYKNLPIMMNWSNIENTNGPVLSKAILKSGQSPSQMIGTPYNDHITGYNGVSEIFLTHGIDKIYPKDGTTITINEALMVRESNIRSHTFINYAKDIKIDTSGMSYCLGLPKGTLEDANKILAIRDKAANNARVLTKEIRVEESHKKQQRLIKKKEKEMLKYEAANVEVVAYRDILKKRCRETESSRKNQAVAYFSDIDLVLTIELFPFDTNKEHRDRLLSLLQ